MSSPPTADPAPLPATLLDLARIDHLTGGRPGRFDLPCPVCGPSRRTPANRRRRVLRIWRLDPGFAGYHCARCSARGHVRGDAVRVDPGALATARQEAAAREAAHAAARLRVARALWARRQPIESSPAERYLREARGIAAPLPATLGFLPARGAHGPALIAAFGLPDEPEPGHLHIDDDQVAGVHITRLAPDGRRKAGTARDKIIIGSCAGAPIVLAPVGDGLGLAICEGIEDALSVHDGSGLGAWAAGAAARLPALAPAVPRYVEAVTILVDDDAAGWRFSAALGRRLAARGVEVTRTVLRAAPRTAPRPRPAEAAA